MEPSNAATAADPKSPLQRTPPPSVEVLQQSLQTSKLPSAEQEQQVVSILKTNPQLMAEFTKQSKAQQPGTRESAGAGGGMDSAKGQQMDDQIQQQQNIPQGGMQQQQPHRDYPHSSMRQQQPPKDFSQGGMHQQTGPIIPGQGGMQQPGSMVPPNATTSTPMNDAAAGGPMNHPPTRTTVTSTVPHQLLQELFQTLKSPTSAEQQQQVQNILTAQFMAELVKQIKSQQPGGNAAAGRGMDSMKGKQMDHQIQQQQNIPQGCMQHPQTKSRISGPGGMQQPGSLVPPNAATSTPMTEEAVGGPMHQALQELIQILKLPTSAEQQQQALNILKANPQLMAAFIRQSKTQYPEFYTKRHGDKSPGKGGMGGTKGQ